MSILMILLQRHDIANQKIVGVRKSYAPSGQRYAQQPDAYRAFEFILMI